MLSFMCLFLLIACYFTMKSFALQSWKYVATTNSTGAEVCSTDQPSQALPMYPGGQVQCGIQCMVSSFPYYQFKSSTPILCEFYNQFPVNFKSIVNCIGYRLPLDVGTDCSFPFTNNGVLYNGCVLGETCLTVNRTLARQCTSNTVVGVMNYVVNTSVQSVSVQSIFGWIIWMRRLESGVRLNGIWNTTWSFYRTGFGNSSDSNYWLGLENVHQLTSSSKYRLRIEMKVKSTGAWISVEYWSFTVGDESTAKYQLNVDGFSGDTLNGLQYVNQPGCGSAPFPNGMKFSTSDADNDRSSGNCAANYGGGWWFNACGYVCLTGSSGAFKWSDNTYGCSKYLPLAEAHMMMKLR